MYSRCSCALPYADSHSAGPIVHSFKSCSNSSDKQSDISDDGTLNAFAHSAAEQVKSQFGSANEVEVCGTDIADIHVKTLTGKQITLDMSLSDTVYAIKSAMHYSDGIPPSQQCLIFTGQRLEDDRTLSDCCIHQGSFVHLALRLRGGPWYDEQPDEAWQGDDEDEDEWQDSSGDAEEYDYEPEWVVDESYRLADNTEEWQWNGRRSWQSTYHADDPEWTAEGAQEWTEEAWHDHCLANGLCFRCGSADHWSSNCPDAPELQNTWYHTNIKDAPYGDLNMDAHFIGDPNSQQLTSSAARRQRDRRLALRRAVPLQTELAQLRSEQAALLEQCSLFRLEMQQATLFLAGLHHASSQQLLAAQDSIHERLAKGVEQFSELQATTAVLTSQVEKLEKATEKNKASFPRKCVPCRFFPQGQCSREDCPFLHTAADKSKGRGKGKAPKESLFGDVRFVDGIAPKTAVKAPIEQATTSLADTLPPLPGPADLPQEQQLEHEKNPEKPFVE